MASFLSLITKKTKYEPAPRLLHTSQTVGSRVLVYSGRTKDYSEKSREQLSSVVEVFNPNTKVWKQKEIVGKTPSPGVYAAACASVNDDLYMYGGFHPGKSLIQNGLHKLESKTYRCSQLSPPNAPNSPMPKGATGIVAFNGNLGVFGGFGKRRDAIQPGSSFINSTSDGRGWTNEFHIYNLAEGKAEVIRIGGRMATFHE